MPGRPAKRKWSHGRPKVIASNPEPVNPEPVLLCQEVSPDSIFEEVVNDSTLPKQKKTVLLIPIEMLMMDTY